MSPINSKNKGNRNELKICEAFNKRFNTTEFQRCPQSGAWGTRLNKKLSVGAQEQLSGDAMVPSNFAFSLECKAGYNIEISRLIDLKSNPDKKKIYEFLSQSSNDARKVSGRKPCVIYRRDRHDPLVFIPKFEVMNYEITHLSFTYEEEETWKKWIMISFDDFLNPEYFPDEFFIISDKEEEKQKDPENNNTR
jgi:hypothetical protein